nr:glycine-rich cell wall structural protein 1.8-like [Aegilops tauschii subsp. strangulata]
MGDGEARERTGQRPRGQGRGGARGGRAERSGRDRGRPPGRRGRDGGGGPRVPRRGNALGLRYGAWVVVTGATDGIGRALALELARRGLHLVLVGRNPAKLSSGSSFARSTGTTGGGQGAMGGPGTGRAGQRRPGWEAGRRVGRPGWSGRGVPGVPPPPVFSSSSPSSSAVVTEGARGRRGRGHGREQHGAGGEQRRPSEARTGCWKDGVAQWGQQRPRLGVDTAGKIVIPGPKSSPAASQAAKKMPSEGLNGWRCS